MHPEQYIELVAEAGLEEQYLETVCRSYYGRRESFEHVVIEAKKP